MRKGVNSSSKTEYHIIKPKPCSDSKCKNQADHYLTYKQRKNQLWGVTEYLCQSHFDKTMKRLRRDKKYHEVHYRKLVLIDPETKAPIKEVAS